MPWQKKSSAPATFSLKNAMAAMLAGTEASWLTDWMFWIPEAYFDTATFCAAGPPPASDGLSITDLLGAAVAGKSPAAWGLLAASLIPKLQAIANERVFGAYCELPNTTPGGWGPDRCAYQGPAAYQNAPPTIHREQAPAGATSVRYRCTQTDGKSGSRVFYCQVYTVNSSFQNITHIGDIIDPTVPTGYSQYSLSGAWGVECRNYDWVMGGTACFSFNDNAPTTTTPTLQPEPAGGSDIHPTQAASYSTIADLGVELDKQEAKLDLIVEGLRYLAGYQATPTATAGTDTTVTVDTKIAVGKAYGAKITVLSIPAAASSIAESPTYWRNLGHVTTYTADGPLGAQEITHSPQVIVFDPRVTDISVSPMKPAGAKVQLLYPTK